MCTCYELLLMFHVVSSLLNTICSAITFQVIHFMGCLSASFNGVVLLVYAEI